MFFIFISSVEMKGQEYEFRFYGGANYYEGDLSPDTGRFSFSPGKVAWAAMAGTKLNDVFKLNLKFMTGQLAGSDSNSKSESRLIRNLSFASPIYELGINTEISINHFLPFLNKYGLGVYYTTGVNVFRFNPKAFNRNIFGELEIVELQPLGTEGQGLPGYDDKYALTQINIPFGLGLKFQLFDNIEMGLELVPRLTFTDHLDDVSGYYVPNDELIAANRPLTAIMANRMGEILGTEVVITTNNALRGNPENNDWYFFSGVYFSYNFGAGFVPRKSIKINPEVDLKLEEETLPKTNQ